MKRNKWIKLTAYTLLWMLTIVLPFLPGPSNNIIVALSVFAQSAGFLGLPLVLVGICWLFIEIKIAGGNANPTFLLRLPYYFAIAIIIFVAAVFLLMLVAASVTIGQWSIGIPAGIAWLLISSIAVAKAVKQAGKLKASVSRNFSSAPLYLIVIPLAAFFTCKQLTEPLSHYSRTIAIKQAHKLIAQIESFKNKAGSYPNSLKQLEGDGSQKIPSTSIMGIAGFRYNLIEGHYSLSFSQWLEFGSLEEIVLYDKNNLRNSLTGNLAKYDYSFDLCRVQGAFAIHDAGYNHWRYYLLD